MKVMGNSIYLTNQFYSLGNLTHIPITIYKKIYYLPRTKYMLLESKIKDYTKANLGFHYQADDQILSDYRRNLKVKQSYACVNRTMWLLVYRRLNTTHSYLAKFIVHAFNTSSLQVVMIAKTKNIEN